MAACGDDGFVPLENVLQAARANGIEVVSAGGVLTFTVDGAPLVYELPDVVHRQMLHNLSRRLGIPIHQFYQPPAPVPLPTAAQPLRAQ